MEVGRVGLEKLLKLFASDCDKLEKFLVYKNLKENISKKKKEKL